MKRAALTMAAILVGVACSDGAPPAADFVPGTPRPGSSSGNIPGADASATDAAVDSAIEADGGDAGPDVWVPGPSVCSPTMMVGTATPVTSTAADDRFGAITADELTIAWTVASGGSAEIRVADRGATTDPFGTSNLIEQKVALDGLALAPTGLTLVAIAEDRRSFAVFERASRSDAFAPGSADAYSPLVAALAEDEKVGDPVFAYGDQVLVYSVYGTSDDTVRYATRLSSGSPWSPGGALAFTELRAQGGLRRRPSGVGDDFQTLFYWDEVSGTEKLGRLEGTVKFHNVHDLGARAFAQPNEACTRIYYGAPGVGGSDIVSAVVQ